MAILDTTPAEVPYGATPLSPKLGTDPAQGVPGEPPNFGRQILPHVYTFQAITGSPAKVYRASDEAIKHSLENARFMRNDLVIMECLEQRQRACALLDWHLEPEDDKDPAQKQLCEDLTKIMKRIPRFMQYRESLLDATWYGKQGCEHRFGWMNVAGQMRIGLKAWQPVHGDKIVFRFDDGSGEHEDGRVGIRVGAGYGLGNMEHRKVEPTDWGLAYFLEDWERSLIAIHKHRIEDGEYEDPYAAGKIHGIGIRSRIYWTWFQKQEALAMLMEFMERSALGIEIWYYPFGNPEAEEKTRTAAQERIGEGRNIIMVPRPVGDDGNMYEVQRIEPGMAGAETMRDIIETYFGHLIKRYILGQTLTSEASGTGLGSNLADVHLGTFMSIVRYDAALLEESITTDLVEPLKRYNFPQMAGHHVRFVIDTEVENPEEKLAAWKTAYEMGLELKAEAVAAIIGASMPMEGDKTLSKAAQDQQAAQTQAMAAGMAQPGADPMAGGPPAPQPGAAGASPKDVSDTHSIATILGAVNGDGADTAKYAAGEPVPSENSERVKLGSFSRREWMARYGCSEDEATHLMRHHARR